MTLAEMTRLTLVLALATIVVGACSSNEEDVCESVGNCTQGGSSDWVQGCNDEAKLLRREANANGCGPLVDDYFDCANANFDCRGATAIFLTCDTKRAALDACVALAKNSCTELDARTRLCANAGNATPARDAGGDTKPVVPVACSAGRDCQARCFLDHIGAACAIKVDELSNYTTCATRCPIDAL